MNDLLKFAHPTEFMKLLDIILLSLAAFFVIIGIYETMAVGIGQAYTWVMISAILFMIYTYRKKARWAQLFTITINW